MNTELILNWGIISTGLIAQDFCSALRHLNSDKQRLRAVGARYKEDAQKFAERFSIPRAYGSYDEVFADTEVNIVYVGSINTTHKENCLKAIQAGKHVLCEKPMSLRSQDQEEVLKAAEAKGVFFMEALWTRFFPVIDLLRQELEKKTIGDVKFFSSSFLLPIKDTPRIREKKLGGGAIFDIGIYPVQLACLVMGHEEPTQICACGHLMDSGVDECASITLLYSNNRIAQLNFSSSCAKFAPTYIVGEKGSIQIPHHSWCPTELIVNDQKHTIPLAELKTNFDNSVGLQFEAEAVRLAIANGLKEHPYATHANSRLILKIILESVKQLGYTGLE